MPETPLPLAPSHAIGIGNRRRTESIIHVTLAYSSLTAEAFSVQVCGQMAELCLAGLHRVVLTPCILPLLLFLLGLLSSVLLHLLDRLVRVLLVAAVGLDLFHHHTLALRCSLSRLHACHDGNTAKIPSELSQLTALSLSLARPSCHCPLPSFCSLSCCCLSFSASSGRASLSVPMSALVASPDYTLLAHYPARLRLLVLGNIRS